PRVFHAIALDDDAGVLYVHGGADERAATGPYFDDLWALDLAKEQWTGVSTAGDVPRGRIGHHMVFDHTTKKLLVFGGRDDGAVGRENDVWTIDPRAATPTWSKLPLGDAPGTPSTAACTFAADFTTVDRLSPERRAAFVFGARPDGHGFVVYGGKSDCGLLGDAWWLSPAASAWTQMVKSPVGLSCLRYSTTCGALCG
ncbi:MAG: kelch repeat-containing protein, partial [Polyangiales bacterium]